MPVRPIRRRSLLVSLASTFALLGMNARANTGGTPPSPLRWAPIELTDSDGRSFHLAALPKPLTLAVVWANWCSICLGDLDALGRMAPRLAAKNINVILISHPQDWTRNQQVAAERGIAFRSVRPSANNEADAVNAAFIGDDGSYYVPRSILFAEAGQSVLWSHVGGMNWAEPGATAPLSRWLG